LSGQLDLSQPLAYAANEGNVNERLAGDQSVQDLNIRKIFAFCNGYWFHF
jgi:hypothetical protein